MAQTEQFTVDVGPVVERMRAFRATWPESDGVAVFNRVYLAVREETDRRADGGFPGRRATGMLDVRLAEGYVAAVDTAAAGDEPPACWRPVFRYRHRPGIAAPQFALAGINAHIGYDLPLAVVRTCRELGCGPAALEGEFDQVGDVLAGLEERIREDLVPGPDLLQVGDPLTHLLGAWSLDRARDAAWSAARILWGIRELPSLTGEFTERMDASVGLVGRILLTPLDR